MVTENNIVVEYRLDIFYLIKTINVYAIDKIHLINDLCLTNEL